MPASIQALALTRRSAVTAFAGVLATLALPVAPGRADGAVEGAGPLDVVSYDAVAERGCGVTRLTTPWYSLTLEDGLFPQGVYWEYDEAGLGFDSAGATEACAILRVYDRASGDLACVVFLTSDLASSLPPFGGYWAVASSSDVRGLGLRLACPVDPAGGEGVFERVSGRAVDLCARLSADDRYALHLVRDPGSGATAVETPHYRIAVPDAMFPQGWRCVHLGDAHDYLGSGFHLYDWVRVVPLGDSTGAFDVYVTSGYRAEGDCVSLSLGPCADRSWNHLELVVAKQVDHPGHGTEEELDILASVAETVSQKSDTTARPLAPAFSAWEDGGLRVVTPYYSVLVPADWVSAGFNWSYDEGVPAEVLAAGVRTHVSAIDLGGGASFEVFCRCASNPAGPEDLARTVGFSSPDGLEVMLSVADGLEHDGVVPTLWRADVESWETYDSSQYFFYIVDEGESKRVVTPYYSVLVPGGVFGDSFDYAFVHGKHVDDVLYDGEMLHRLILEFRRQGEISGFFEVYCLKGDSPAGDGPVAMLRSGLVSPDGLNVDVACAYVWKPAADAPLYEISPDEARVLAEEFVLAVEPAPAGAPIVERLRYVPYLDKPGTVKGVRPTAQ